MNDYTNWDIGKIKKSTEEWINDETQKKFFYQLPIEEIESFLKEEFDNLGMLAGNLNELSYWYFNRGAIKVLNENLSGFNDIILSAIYNYWYIRITYEFNLKINKKTTLNFNAMGLSLSRLISLGLFNKAHEILKVLLKGINQKVFIGLSYNFLTSFILQLHCKWKKIEVPKKIKDDFKIIEVYKNILDRLEREEEKTLNFVLEKACDFHIERSRYDTDKEFYEFSEELYMIYPVEIMAILRIREQLGFIVPTINHKLMDNPLCDLNILPENEGREDDLLKEVLDKKIIKDLLNAKS